MKEFFGKSAVACGFQKIMLDKNGVPYNYKFINVNEEFEKMCGLKSIDIIGKTFDQLFPEHYKNQGNWMKTIQEASLSRTIFKLESYDEIAKKYLSIIVFPIRRRN